MKERNKSIYIEGTDLAGKTVVGNEVAKCLDIKNITRLYLHPDENPWNVDRTRELALDDPLFPAYLVGAVIWDIVHFEPQDHLLQISFVAARSAAWQLTSGESLAPVFVELLDFTPEFGSSVLLHASLETKLERLKQRLCEEPEMVSAIDLKVKTDPEFVTEMDKNLIQIAREKINARIIDTSPLTISQVANKVLQPSSNQEGSIQLANNCHSLNILPEMMRFHREIIQFSRCAIRQHNLPVTRIDDITKKLGEI